MFIPIVVFSMDKDEAKILIVEANTAYGNGETELATALYDSVLQAFTSADIHYNLGNCYFKMGDLPNAVLNYERAWKLAPGDEDIYHNLRAADRLVVDDISELPMVDLGNGWRRFQAGEDRDQWAIISIIFCAIGFILLTIMIVNKKPWIKRSAFFVSLFIFMFCISSIVLASLRAQEINENSKAVIFSPKVDIHSEPNTSSTKLLILHEGSTVEVEDQQGEWTEVRLPNGTGGWLLSASIEVI